MATPKPKLLVTRLPTAVHAKVHQQLEEMRKDFDITIGVDDWMDRGELFRRLADVDAVVAWAADKMNKEAIDHAPKLKLISNFGAGYDSVDVPHATSKGIWVSNTPEMVNDATSDVAMFLILAVCRRTTEAERALRSNKWPSHPEEYRGMNPRGKTLGIIGMGNIGKQVAEKAKAFGLRVIYYNRKQLDADTEKQLGATYVSSLDELLSTSDIVSVHTPLTPDTRHLLGRPQFDKIKHGAFVVNTARGPIIDEAALVDALKTGKVGGAGLDVFEAEPKVTAELLDLPNVTLLPHIGTMTAETRGGMWGITLDNVQHFFKTGKPKFPVNSPKPK